MQKRSYAVPSLIQYIKCLYRYQSITNNFFAITTLCANNMETRLSKPQVFKLKMVPKSYPLLSTTFEIKWSVIDGLVEDLSVGRWLVVFESVLIWSVGRRIGGGPVGGLVVDGRWSVVL